MARPLLQKWMIVALFLLPTFLISCGLPGGGSGGGGGGSDSAVSGHVPYIVSGPKVSYATNSDDPSKYDVTVELEADGPTGVKFVDLWIFDKNDSGNFTHLDLMNVPSTKRWTATTETFLPLVPGDYYLDSIVLNDGDPFTDDPLRTGWYMKDPVLSSDLYFVDEREISGGTFVYYNSGLSDIHIRTFTLP